MPNILSYSNFLVSLEAKNFVLFFLDHSVECLIILRSDLECLKSGTYLECLITSGEMTGLK
jgi:hypothetical protein